MAEVRLKRIDCGGCTKCCIRDPIPLAPEERSQFKSQRGPQGSTIVKLDKKTGSCVYLNEIGCSIHGKAPKVCQEFDCRVSVLRTAAAEPHQIASRLTSMHIVACLGEGLSRLSVDAPEVYADPLVTNLAAKVTERLVTG